MFDEINLSNHYSYSKKKQKARGIEKSTRRQNQQGDVHTRRAGFIQQIHFLQGQMVQEEELFF